MEKVKALSDNYVIKNAKKANKLIEEMKKKVEKKNSLFCKTIERYHKIL